LTFDIDFQNLKKLYSKFLFWIRIRIGSGFNDYEDPDQYPDIGLN
jgi:hypothetical protein